MNSKITLIRDKNSGKYLGFEAIVNDEVVEVKNENLEEFKKDLAKYMEQLVQDNYQKEYDNLSNKEIREDLMKKGLITEKLITLNKTPIVAKEKTTETKLPEEANVKGRKKLKVSKKTLALIVGGAIAVSGLGVGITALVNANK